MRRYSPPTEHYFRMYNKVFDLNLRATTFLLYSYLLCCAGSKGYCWPSLETISRKTGLSVSTIQDHLKILEQRQLIRKSKHGVPGWNKNNVYTLLDLENPEVYGYLKQADKQLVDAIVSKLANEPRIQKLYRLWYGLKEDVLRTYTNKMPERIPLEENKEFKAIRNAVIQAALKITIPQPSHLSEPCLPRVDFVDDGTEVYQQAAKSLLEPAVTPSPEVEQFFHDAAIRGSVDAIYGMGMLHQETDAKKSVGFFELAAEQGNTYAEYQLGKMYCFGEGIPQNLEAGMAWLKSAADHGNPYAAPLLQYVQEQTQAMAVQGAFGLLKGLARMIRSEGEQEYHYKHHVESKLMQQIREKKQALGIRSEQEEQGLRMQ